MPDYSWIPSPLKYGFGFRQEDKDGDEVCRFEYGVPHLSMRTGRPSSDLPGDSELMFL